MTSRSSLSRLQSPASPVADADLVRSDDPRNSNSRPPNNHAGNHAPGGGDSINDSYMDLSTGQTVSGVKTFNGTAIFNAPPQVAEGNLAYHPVRRDDPRMVNARDPNAHVQDQTTIVVASVNVTYSTSVTVSPLANVAVSRFTMTATGNSTVTLSTTNMVDGQVVRFVILASGGARTITLATATGLSTGITDRAMTITSGQVGVFGLEYIGALNKWVLFSEYVSS